MNTVAMDSLGWLGLALIPLYLIFVLFVARFCALNTRGEERQAQAERFEVDGSWDEYLASMEAKKRRADERRRRWQDAA